jgi:protein tyrosine/serine phosphatase
MTERLRRFEAIDNFRDFGDYAGVAGRHVRPGRLFRSAHQARATEADLAALAELDLGVVVDLRRPSERRGQPSRRPEGFAAQLIESAHDDGGEAPHMTFLKTADLTEESGRTFMTDTYRRLPFEASHIDLFRRYFEALAESDRPVLIHCAAGKDRTGLLAALTHHLLGVGHDDLMADYLLTNTAVDLDGQAGFIAERLKTMTGRTGSHAAVVAFLGVAPEFMDAALAEMTTAHGSVDGYLAEALGVDTARRDRILERLSA